MRRSEEIENFRKIDITNGNIESEKHREKESKWKTEGKIINVEDQKKKGRKESGNK